jgi:MFS family permease
LAAVAIVPILTTVFQTFVLTDVTGDVIRKGLEAEHYTMIWPQILWGIGLLYGVFSGIWASPRYGARNTLLVGLGLFVVGNVLCGAALDVSSMTAAKLVEGIGKGMVIVMCRSLLYRQFDRFIIVAIGFYGVIAYATRPTTPLLTSFINDSLGWRWIYWINVPLALLAVPLVLRFVRPDRPARPRPLKIDWFTINAVAGWAVSLELTVTWYRKWGGLTSNAFTACLLIDLAVPLLVIARLARGLAVDEHLRRMFSVRVYVLAMVTRILLLVQLLMVMALLAKYCVDVREYPRSVAGWVLVPATFTMAASTFLTTFFRRRRLRHFWLLVGVVGCAASLWWMSSIDGFTSKGRLALMIGCWGLFEGLIPPSFLQDEVEGLNPKDFLYGGALAAATLILAFILIPPLTTTTIAAWTDRSLEMERMNVRENRPEVQEASLRIADHYQQCGVAGPELAQMTSTVLGSFARSEAVAQGIQRGLQFLSLVVAGIGLPVVALLSWSSKHGPVAAPGGAIPDRNN